MSLVVCWVGYSVYELGELSVFGTGSGSGAVMSDAGDDVSEGCGA